MDSPVFGGDMRSDATYTMLQSVDRCKPRLKTDEELAPFEPRVQALLARTTPQANVAQLMPSRIRAKSDNDEARHSPLSVTVDANAVINDHVSRHW